MLVKLLKKSLDRVADNETTESEPPIAFQRSSFRQHEFSDRDQFGCVRSGANPNIEFTDNIAYSSVSPYSASTGIKAFNDDRFIFFSNERPGAF